ncbi:hypothetical protein LZ31DRAFT_560938 [Colletotrichum somersetense]|nr:hypothetical protein LZ31DRAFT_560938 [Colletotrichum somersetense]
MLLVAAPTLAWLAESVLPDRVDPCAVDHRLGNQSLKHFPSPEENEKRGGVCMGIGEMRIKGSLDRGHEPL